MIIDVVAAMICDDNKFMICQRPETKARPLCWEFPGGKVDSNETKESALIRECSEELGIILKVHENIADTIYAYDEISIHLYLFTAYISEGVPQLKEHKALRWITKDEISEYNFCPADRVILQKLF